MKYLLFILIAFVFLACAAEKEQMEERVMKYPNILDISHTPTAERGGGKGWFTDQGAWMGFTLPQREDFTNGFCGPFDLDNRQWVSKAIVRAGYTEDGKIISPSVFIPDTMVYYPGHLFMRSCTSDVCIEQELRFINKNDALLLCRSNKKINWFFEGNIWGTVSRVETAGQSLIIGLPKGEYVAVTFGADANLMLMGAVYKVAYDQDSKEKSVVISFYNSREELDKGLVGASGLAGEYVSAVQKQQKRWEGYIGSVLRDSMPEAYDRIAVKSLVTLLSNWRSSKRDLLHDGMVPSHAAGYFVGFWAWDTWKQAVATVHFEPELARNQIRSMFDFQDEYGMIADCVYSDKSENNYRDSKPPLAAWSVDEVFKVTGDTAFLREMYPKLLKYYRWWYEFRDNDKNGICEFGSTDGTEEAAKWESGMDNAVRFDDAVMVKNGDNAWSFNQESVDLNAYLAYEYGLLGKMAALIDEKFDEPDRREQIRDYFYDAGNGYFFDKMLKGDFVRVEGPEGWTPLWANLATPEQAAGVMKIIADTNKFSTYIPFPTLAADHPKFLPGGYWRGPIWLDQVYFGISGIRKYGYKKEADKYTEQVFTRLKGLSGDAPIHENYDTHTGGLLKAPHFSWSSAHLLMLYWELNT